MHKHIIRKESPSGPKLALYANGKIRDARIAKGGVRIGDRGTPDGRGGQRTESLRSCRNSRREGVRNAARRGAEEQGITEQGCGFRASPVGCGRKEDSGRLGVVKAP